ncbi:hypothetical protein AMS66_19840 [Paenibacillus xylanivorans]|uniref:Transposase n=1 Tax=Paenibacillus xylanivorans TaxID=1705561 RepID=A0A0N0C3S6_9BACL|nr:hypothetical protein AMS66_19840 [Paenibacillus xylanivorans]
MTRKMDTLKKSVHLTGHFALIIDVHERVGNRMSQIGLQGKSRGSNENANGLLREFFPKGHDFATVTDAELAEAIRLINHRPRKCLDWRSAHEAFMDELSHLA